MTHNMENTSTQLYQLNSHNPDSQVINLAAQVIIQGGLVAFPTETVYGLGANGLDGAAVAKIYQAKGRPSDNPLILHVAEVGMVGQLCQKLSDEAQLLMSKFWPGPLTLVLPKAEGIPQEVTGGLQTVAVRMPDHPVALALIKAAGVPIAAPSANKSGRPSPTTATHVQTDLQGRIDVILDGGPAGLGVESTVLDLSSPIPTILRPGGVTYEQLCQVLKEITIDPSVLGEKLPQDQAPRSPGMKYIHYAPAAPVILFEGEPEQVRQSLLNRAKELLTQGKRIGILATEESAAVYPSEAIILKLGHRETPAAAATRLFALLREFDQLKVETILAESVPPKGIGLAVLNRLRRAAGEIVRS